MTENSYSYVDSNPVGLVDPLGLKATCKCTDSGAEININFKFNGPAATPETISNMRTSIENLWSSPGFRMTTRIGGPQATNINVMPGRGRAFMQGNSGTWYEKGSEWEPAHESGHIMGLIDQYDDVASGTKMFSNPRPGWENTMMGQYNGQVTPVDRQAALAVLGCNCDCGGSP